MRARVTPEFGLGVKLNSADFQKGGFDAEDAAAVVRMLNSEAVAMVGIGQALAYAPDLPKQWQDAEIVVDIPAAQWKSRALSGMATMVMTKTQLRRMGAGKVPIQRIWARWELILDQIRSRQRNRQYRNLLSQHSNS